MAASAQGRMARTGRVVAAAAICAVGAAILAFAVAHNSERTDFLTYWAAGQQLAHRLNPYDGAAILRLQEQAGYGGGRPFFMRNPPWAFFLALPLGFVRPVVGSFLWSCGLLLALIVSIRFFWARVGTQNDTLRLVSYVSAPAAMCLLQQQTSLFLLLGFTLFFCLVETSPVLAGAALLIPAAKPHLALPFWIVLLLWSVSRRRFTVLAGFAIALLASLALAFALDPHCFAHYEEMVRESQIANDLIPSLSQLLRLTIHPDWTWLQVLPAAIACCWAPWYFVRDGAHWDWLRNGSMVLLVSVVAAPYAWFPDQSVLLVALMAGLHFAETNRRALVVYVILSGAAFLQIMAMGEVRSFWMVWTAPAWLLWYGYATRASNVRVVPAAVASV